MGCSARGWPSLSGDGPAAWRRSDGALWRGNLGEGSGGSGGLDEGEGLYCGGSYAGGSAAPSMCGLPGWLGLANALLVGEKPLGGRGEAGGVYSLPGGRYGTYCGLERAAGSGLELLSPWMVALRALGRAMGSSIVGRARGWRG